MPKLRPQLYKRADGSTALNCFNLSIKKTIAANAGFTPEDELRVIAENGRIIVEKASNGR